MILIFIALLGISLAIFGLWMAVQSRLRFSEERLRDSFKALSMDALENHSRIFLDLAKTALDKYQEGAKVDLDSRQKAVEAAMHPFREAIQKIDENQRELEKRREGAYAALSKQIEGMVLVERELRRETTLLSQSLRSPQVRGAWGQVHLRRVVELAGMMNHCDFFEQKTMDDGERIQRPDLLVRLPGQRQMIIDAKTPLHSYLDGSDAGDEELRKKKLQEHAMSLRKHIKDLASKEYWKQFDAIEYVVLFLPAEAFFSAALQADPSLIEVGADQNILIATPTTLIAILRAVALSWKQETLSKNAREISQLGKDLYERIGIFCEHWNKMGKNLNGAVESFNQAAASFETRVLVSARKLKEMGQIQKELPETSQIDKEARSIATSIS